jgi:DNA helicase-2/ATP-dependent DNA helicase PcrA
MSQQLIAINSRRVEKTIRAARTDDALVEVQVTENLNIAMERVHTEIKNFIGQGKSPSRVAIIGKQISQLIPYQIFFASNQVPFCAAEDLQVFMSKAFECILSLITIKTRCDTRRRKTEVLDDLLELCDLVNRFPLSKNDKQALRDHLSKSEVSTVLQAVESLELYRGPLMKREKANQQGKISLNMAKAIRFFLQARTVSESIRGLGDNFEGLQIDIGKAEDDIFFKDPPFLHLAEYAIKYKDDYIQFIEDVEQAKEQLARIPPVDDDQLSSLDELWKRPVHLMTAIRSKGKEFDSVILLDMNDDIWPNKNAQTPEQKEAERRVFYVAFTRAKRRVLMLVSKRLGNREAIPSPFLGEMGLT